MMELPNTPQKWAIQLTRLLNARDGENRFPVDVEDLALMASAHFFPDDPITLIKGKDIQGFEGMLHRAPPGKLGWGIFYNSGVTSEGRIRFTKAHEFGHYLLHRNIVPGDVFACGNTEEAPSDPEYRQREREADEFAANLLMPLDDFRRQIDPRQRPTIEQLSACSERYGVSFMAAILRWLEYTETRAVMVKSIEGFIDWARSSQPAFQTGAYFKTVNRDPIEIPSDSLAANPTACDDPRLGMPLPAGTWFPREDGIIEMVINSDQYDFTLSLLLLPNVSPMEVEKDEEEVPFLTTLAW